jgi:hypothetical protein
MIAQAEESRDAHKPAPRAPVRKAKAAAAATSGGAATARAEPADAGWEEF